MSLYVLVGPDGEPCYWTVHLTADEAWVDGFETVAATLGHEWRERFWKRIGPSRISARRLGWRVVKCHIVLDE